MLTRILDLLVLALDIGLALLFFHLGSRAFAAGDMPIFITCGLAFACFGTCAVLRSTHNPED